MKALQYSIKSLETIFDLPAVCRGKGGRFKQGPVPECRIAVRYFYPDKNSRDIRVKAEIHGYNFFCFCKLSLEKKELTVIKPKTDRRKAIFVYRELLTNMQEFEGRETSKRWKGQDTDFNVSSLPEHQRPKSLILGEATLPTKGITYKTIGIQATTWAEIIETIKDIATNG